MIKVISFYKLKKQGGISMKRIFVVLLMVVLMTSLLSGCSNQNSNEAAGTEQTNKEGNQQETQEVNQQGNESKKAAIVLGVGGLGDQSYNDLAYQGMKDAESQLGISFDYAEPKAMAEFEVHLREMASEGQYVVIVCVGFEQVDALSIVADEFPDQKFAILDGSVDKPNVASFLSKEEEGSFLIGALAGLMKLEPENYGLSDEQILGFVGALDVPVIRKFHAGFMAGAKYVNPDIQVLDDIVGGFSDVTTAKEIALTMNSKGADIIYHAAGGSGMGVFQAAAENDFIAMGVNSNQNYIDPEHIVASMLKRIDVAAFTVVKEASEGTLQTGGITELGLKDEGIGYTIEGTNIKVSSSTIEKVEELKQKVIDGELLPPLAVESVETFLSENKAE
ncbi:MAG: basic rane lipoprotein [Anaerocolumna sp.]|jgi:basic membrane protein A|nr:basic rane lipoprotein [Anaerocolumna sp.]